MNVYYVSDCYLYQGQIQDSEKGGVQIEYFMESTVADQCLYEEFWSWLQSRHFHLYVNFSKRIGKIDGNNLLQNQ